MITQISIVQIKNQEVIYVNINLIYYLELNIKKPDINQQKSRNFTYIGNMNAPNTNKTYNTKQANNLKLNFAESKSKNKLSSKEKTKVEMTRIITSSHCNLRNIHSSIGKNDPKSLIDKFFITFKSREENVNLDCKNNTKINGK